MRFQVLGFLSACLGGFGANARVVSYGVKPVTVQLSYGTPTLFRFPQEVKTIAKAARFQIEPANPTDPSYLLLSIRPRFMTGSNEVAFILSDGSIVRAKLVVVKDNENGTDAIYDFKPKESANEGSSGPVTEIDLLRAMIRGEDAPGYASKVVSQEVRPGFKGVSTRLVGVYTGEKFRGYIFEITNATRHQSLVLNIQNLMLGDPNTAIVASADSFVLSPRGEDGSKTYIRLVAKLSSQAERLVLPVQVAKEKEVAK